MANSKMAGYQLASDDLTHVPAKFMCKQCSFVLREPLQTPCAHFYCRDCLTCLKSGDIYKCKVDDEEFTQAEVFPDGCVRKEIQQLPVHCSHQDNGCEWKGKLECLEAHIAVCDFEEIACVFENCGQKVRKSRLAEHLETECSQRQVKCEFCNEEMPQASLEEHTKKTCQSFPINCSLCNKKDIPRKELRDHHDPVTGDCEESKTVCPFRPLGCNNRKEMKRKEKQEHEDNLVSLHLSLLVRFVFTLRDQVGYYVHEINPLREGLGVMERLKRTVSQLVSQVTIVVRDTKKMGDEIQGLKTRVRRVEESCVETDSVPARGQRSLLDQCQQFSGMFTDMKRALSNMQANIDNHELLIVEANRTIEEQNNENVWLKRQVDNHKEAMKRLQAKVDSLEEASRTRNVNSPAVGLQNSAGGDEANSFDGVLLWRISNVAEKIYEAMNAAENSSYSAPFYTSRHGYKMCARIYLNGDGMGKGTHISLFFVIMRGQYDGLLRWPFRQKVTMMLLDQDNVEHVIDAFRPDPGSSSFQKPRREMNIASGCPLFFPLAELNNHPYIKDDTMFIKIIVDCSDL